MAKKKKNSKAAKRRRARQRRRMIILCCFTLVLFVAAVILISKFTPRKDEVAAVNSYLDFEDQDAFSNAILPEEDMFADEGFTETEEMLEFTSEPTEAPTAEPTATAEPEPTATPYAGPTPDPTRAPAYITITATGDVTLGSGGREHIRNFTKYYDQNGYQYFFENVRDYFAEDDITIVNLEGPLTSSKDMRPRRRFNFRGEPEYVQILTYGNVELCNIANNHLMDYKERGAQDTINILQEAGIGASGGIDNKEIPYYTEVNGYKVGSVGFTEWNFDEKTILKNVEEAAAQCDLLIVSMHWNEEGAKQLSSYCVKMGEKLIDLGADIVIGNHTHRVGEIRKYKGKYIINSLGNFCFGGNDILFNYETDVFRQRFLLTDNGEVVDAGIDLKPALNYTTMERKKNNFKPGWPDTQLGIEILQTVLSYSKKLDTNEIVWLPTSFVAENNLVSQIGGKLAEDVPAEEAAAMSAVNSSMETIETETSES